MHAVQMAAFTSGHEAWISEHFQENYALLYAIGRLFVSASEAEQMIQNAFAKLWSKRDALCNVTWIDRWLVDAMRRQLHTYMRRNGLQKNEELPEMRIKKPAGPLPDPATLLGSKARYDMLSETLGKEDATLFFAFCVLHYSAEELAVQYGVSVACIWTRINRCKCRILASASSFFSMMLAFTMHV